MKRLMTLMLALSFLGTTVAACYAQDTKTDKTTKKKTSKKKKAAAPKKEG
jgi:hypothetical protein